MDNALILKGTLAQVQHDLAVINAVAAAWWASQGYTVIDTPSGKAVVGKNAATGEDNPNAMTTTWAEPRPVNFTMDEQTGEITPEEGTEWYIMSPSSDPRFADWRLYIPDGTVTQCQEVEL